MHSFQLPNISQITPSNFEEAAMELFQFQWANCEIYRDYGMKIGTKAADIRNIHQIPFLPIRFFKTHSIKSGSFEPQLIFESSGTTGSTPSKHHIKDIALYEQSFLLGFNQFYGDPSDYCILGLLPSYLERGSSSLVFMTNRLMEISNHPKNGFFLHDFGGLHQTIIENEKASTPTLLIGVTYALLDFAEKFPMSLRHTLVMETGGMKGRREELPRATVHQILCRQLGLKTIHAEYGMTELLTQAYSKNDGIFITPPHMRILLREIDDPLSIIQSKNAHAGAINIIDLANQHSLSFIATDDLGFLHSNGSFEITGRIQDSDIRGCGLMYLPE